MILKYPGKQHVVQDDIESFVWVALYHVLRYTRHSITINKLQDALVRTFDDYSYLDGVYKGGTGKDYLCSDRGRGSVLGENFMVEDNPALTSFVTTALDALKEWHTFIDPPVTNDIPQKTIRKQKSSTTESDLFFFDESDLPHEDVTPDLLQTTPAPIPLEKIQLRNHAGIAKAWLGALNLEWPSGDKAKDNLPDDTSKGISSKRGRGDDGTVVEGAPKKKSKSTGSSMGTPFMTASKGRMANGSSLRHQHG
jgi:hypothetical protein